MAEAGIKCYQCERHPDFSSYIELRNHLEMEHCGLSNCSLNRGCERRSGGSSGKGNNEVVEVKWKLERSNRAINTLTESLEMKEQSNGQLQEDLWIMTEQRNMLEKKCKDACQKMEKMEKNHAKDISEKQRKTLLKIKNMGKIIDELKCDKTKIQVEKEELEKKTTEEKNRIKEEINCNTWKEELERAKIYAQECYEKLNGVEKIAVNQKIEIEELNEAVEDLKQIIQDLEEEIVYLSKENKILKEEHQKLKASATKKEEKVKQLENSCRKQEKILSQLKTNHECLIRKNATANKDANDACLEAKQLQYELDSEKQKYNHSEVERKGLLANINEMKMAMKIKDIQSEEYKERFEFMKTEIKILQNKTNNDNEVNMQQKQMDDVMQGIHLNHKGANWGTGRDKNGPDEQHWAFLAKDGTNEQKKNPWEQKDCRKNVDEEMVAGKEEQIRLRDRIEGLETELHSLKGDASKYYRINKISDESEISRRLKGELETQRKKSKLYEKQNKELQKSLYKLKIQLTKKDLQCNKEGNDGRYDEIQRRYEDGLKRNCQLFERIHELQAENDQFKDELQTLRDRETMQRRRSVEEKSFDNKDRKVVEQSFTEKIKEVKSGKKDEKMENCLEIEDRKVRDGDDIDYGNEEAFSHKGQEAKNAIMSLKRDDRDDEMEIKEETNHWETYDDSESLDTESLESLEFKYLEAKIKYENHKADIFAAITRSNNKLKSGLRLSETGSSGIEYGLGKDSIADNGKSNTSVASPTQSCHRNLRSPPASGDWSAAFYRRRSSRFENVDSVDEMRQKSRRIMSRKELEIISEDSGNKTEFNSSETLKCHADAGIGGSDASKCSRVDQCSIDTDGSVDADSALMVADSAFVDSCNNVRDQDSKVKSRDASAQRIASASTLIESESESYTLANGYLQALEKIDSKLRYRQSGECDSDAGSIKTEYLSEDQLVNQLDVCSQLNVENEGLIKNGGVPPKRKIYNKVILDSQVQSELLSKLGTKNESGTGECSARPEDRSIVNAEKLCVGDSCINDTSDNGRYDAEHQIQGIGDVEKSNSLDMHEKEKEKDAAGESRHSLYKLPSFENVHKAGRRHSLAYELLRRQHLDYEFQQEYRASNMKGNSTRRISSGEVDAEKLKLKAEEDKTKKSPLSTDQNEAIAQIGWFQMVAISERAKKLEDKSKNQNNNGDKNETEINDENGEGKTEENQVDKNVNTDDSDLSIYSSDLDDSSDFVDSSDYHDSSDFGEDNLDVNGYIKGLPASSASKISAATGVLKHKNETGTEQNTNVDATERVENEEGT
eukprot:gene19208-21132_t